MKVLTLNWGWGATSIGKIIDDIEVCLRDKDIEFFHVYESGDLSYRYNTYRLNNWFQTRIYYLFSKLSGIRYGVGYIPYLKTKKIIRKFKPDIIHIHCPNGHSINIYKLLDDIKKHSIPVVITNHAEFFYTGSCSYSVGCERYREQCKHCPDYKKREGGNFLNLTNWAWKKMYHALDYKWIKMVAVSPWVYEKMLKSPITKVAGKQCLTILNGVNTDIFKVYEDIAKKDNDKLRILAASGGFSLNKDDIKGGYYLVQLAELCSELDVEFLIAGANNHDYEVPSNVHFLGYIADQIELAKQYNQADLTIVTSKRETFGMPVAESLCCGTPIIGFENGGSESIALEEYCRFVKQGDVEGLYNIIKNYKKNGDSYDIAEAAKQKYSRERMANEYYKLYCNCIKEQIQ